MTSRPMLCTTSTEQSSSEEGLVSEQTRKTFVNRALKLLREMIEERLDQDEGPSLGGENTGLQRYQQSLRLPVAFHDLAPAAYR